MGSHHGGDPEDHRVFDPENFNPWGWPFAIYLFVVPGGIAASYWLYARKTGAKFHAHEAKKAAAAAAAL
jgi:hypothetical protein